MLRLMLEVGGSCHVFYNILEHQQVLFMGIGQTPFILSPPGYSLDLSQYRLMNSLKYMSLFATFIGCRLIRLKGRCN
jgi:hypothetical protein